MLKDTQIRSKILRKIQRIPFDRLKEIVDFVSKLESPTNKKEINLSYAGAWKNIGDDTFESLTDDLIKRRRHNKRRVNE